MAKRIDFPVIEKGAEYALDFQCLESDEETLVDLTDTVARFTIRAPDASGVIVYDVRSDDTSGELALDLATSTFQLRIPASVTALLGDGVDGCKGWATMKRWPSGDEDAAVRMAEGPVRWSPESTRDDESGA